MGHCIYYKQNDVSNVEVMLCSCRVIMADNDGDLPLIDGMSMLVGMLLSMPSRHKLLTVGTVILQRIYVAFELSISCSQEIYGLCLPSVYIEPNRKHKP